MCCSVPTPRRCKERVTAPNRDFAASPATPRREAFVGEEQDGVAPFVVHALEIARSIGLDEPTVCAQEPRARRRAAG